MKALIISAGILFSGLSIAEDSFEHKPYKSEFHFKPYLGVNYGLRNGGFEKPFGGQILKEKQPNLDTYFGFKFHENFGIELGYEKTNRSKKNKRLFPGDFWFGRRNNTNFIDFQSRSKVHGWHLGVVSNWRIKYDIPLNFLFKVALKKARYKVSTTLLNRAGNFLQSSEMKSNKTILKLSGGLEYELLKYLNIRGFVSWENSSRLKSSGLSSPNRVPVQTKMKDALLYNLGFVVFLPQ